MVLPYFFGTLEPTLAIVCACLPIFRPLVTGLRTSHDFKAWHYTSSKFKSWFSKNDSVVDINARHATVEDYARLEKDASPLPSLPRTLQPRHIDLLQAGRPSHIAIDGPVKVVVNGPVNMVAKHEFDMEETRKWPSM